MASKPVEITVEREDGSEERLEFRPARMDALLKAGKVSHAVGSIWSAVQSGEQARAVVVLMETLGDKLSRQTLLDLLLDSLRRDSGEAERDKVLKSYDGPTLLSMFAAVAAANAQRAAPLLLGLVESVAASLRESVKSSIQADSSGA